MFAALSLGYLVNAQTVENITVQSEEDKIIVTYRIGGSTDAQYYSVTLSCSMDGGRRFEPKTKIGDVDEVGNVEFFMKVDLVNDMAPVITQQQRQPQVQPQKQPTVVAEKIEISEPNPGLPDYDAVDTQKEEIPWSSLAYTGSKASPIGSFLTFDFGVINTIGRLSLNG